VQIPRGQSSTTILGLEIVDSFSLFVKPKTKDEERRTFCLITFDSQPQTGFNTPMENFPLRSVVNEVIPRLESLSEDFVSQPRVTGKWSRKEILGHLIDSACNNHRRFVKMQIQSGQTLDGYEQDDWVRLQNYQQESWKAVVTLWQAYNLHLAHVVAQIPAESLSNTCVLGGKTLTLEFLMKDYLRHLKHHLTQILELG
jgi:DinB superfamily